MHFNTLGTRHSLAYLGTSNRRRCICRSRFTRPSTFPLPFLPSSPSPRACKTRAITGKIVSENGSVVVSDVALVTESKALRKKSPSNFIANFLLEITRDMNAAPLRRISLRHRLQIPRAIFIFFQRTIDVPEIRRMPNRKTSPTEY